MRLIPCNPSDSPTINELEDTLTMLLTDEQWEAISRLPQVGRAHPVGRRPTDDREVLEAVLWVMRYRARWQDLPREYPSPRTCQRRLRRWQESGQWEQIWQTYIDMLDDQALHEWGAAFMEIVLAESDDPPRRHRGTARIGRPPFWWPMARDFFRRTWAQQPEDRRQRLADVVDHVLDIHATRQADAQSAA
jgi:transposase